MASRQVPPSLYLHSSVAERWNLLENIQRILSRFKRATTIQELRGVFSVSGELGKGVYGIVYSALMRVKPVAGSHIAVKSISTKDRPNDRLGLLKRLVREEAACAFLNALVLLRVCPNFVMFYKAFLTRNYKRTNLHHYLILMEKADGNLKQWVDTRAGKTLPAYMSCMLQICMAIVSMASHVDLCHNDLYLKNILYNEIYSTHYTYVCYGRTYTISNCRHLFKISDFGICSSPTYLKNQSHMEMHDMTPEQRHFTGTADFDFSKHILEYNNVPPFARDLIVFLRSMSYYAVHEACKSWNRSAMQVLTNRINDGHFYNAHDIRDFVTIIFDGKFLFRNGISSQLFQQPHPDAEIFYVEGDENTKRSMVWNAHDHIGKS
jgi:serine/threonine protein kinase